MLTSDLFKSIKADLECLAKTAPTKVAKIIVLGCVEPRIRDMLLNVFKPREDELIEDDSYVVCGASVWAANLLGKIDLNCQQIVTREFKIRRSNEPIVNLIKKHKTLPISMIEKFQVYPDQSKLSIHVYEDYDVLFAIVIPVDYREHNFVEIKFSVDLNGCLAYRVNSGSQAGKKSSISKNLKLIGACKDFQDQLSKCLSCKLIEVGDTNLKVCDIHADNVNVNCDCC